MSARADKLIKDLSAVFAKDTSVSKGIIEARKIVARYEAQTRINEMRRRAELYARREKDCEDHANGEKVKMETERHYWLGRSQEMNFWKKNLLAADEYGDDAKLLKGQTDDDGETS